MAIDKTIFALSSGHLPSGVAVVRISGPNVKTIWAKMVCGEPVLRKAQYALIKDPRSGEVLDHAIALLFYGPSSFTGEDCLELHLHGGKAVVEGVIEALSSFSNTQLAEAGEFTRRAFANGKLDLTAVEAISDLIASQTSGQRNSALKQLSGSLREIVEAWRAKIIRMRALVEADFDFADEEDVPGSVMSEVWQDAVELSEEIHSFLESNKGGEIIRDGFKIAILGPPNAGKSSLLNALAKRDVAIVSDEAGTTRDILEVTLNLGGIPVVIGDTAGQRETDSIVEQEGVRRGLEYASNADFIIWADSGLETKIPDGVKPDLRILTKRDQLESDRIGEFVSTSVITTGGLDELIDHIKARATAAASSCGDSALITRQRHRECLERCVEELIAVGNEELSDEIRAEHLRIAGDSIGQITGAVDVEELLGVIFSEFCIGK